MSLLDIRSSTLSGVQQKTVDCSRGLFIKWDSPKGLEAASEFICSELLKHATIAGRPLQHRECWIETDGAGKPVSCSRLDLPKDDLVRVTLDDLLGVDLIEPSQKYSSVECLASLLEIAIQRTECLDFFIQYIGCLLFDWLVFNDDRHLRNTEFDLSSEGNVALVPAFDFGRAFFSFEEGAFAAPIPVLRRKQKCKPFGLAQVTAVQRQASDVQLVVNASQAIGSSTISMLEVAYSRAQVSRILDILAEVLKPARHFGGLVTVT